MNASLFRIAWREARAASGKFLFVAAAIAVGVGSLGGVRGFSRAFKDMLLRDARVLMAADISVRLFDLPTAEQQKTFDALEGDGVRRTWITETVSMMASPSSPDPVLVAVKAVDPKAYPFYGSVTLEPPGAFAERLTNDVVLVSDDLLVRMSIRVGDRVRLGAGEFRIGGIITAEPDRMAGSINVGPRVMITRPALEASGLILPGSRAAQRHLFKLKPGADVGRMRDRLRAAFPNALVADFRETHPLITRGLERATTFLSLVSLIAMIVGALGVATAMHAHIQQKLDSIAIMKAIGGRSSQIVRIYVAQSMMLAAAGGVAGFGLSYAVQKVFPLLLRKYFPTLPELTFEWLPSIEGLAVALLTTLLFTLWPLMGIRRVAPNVIFRREMAETRKRRIDPWAVGVAALILVGIAAIAAWLASGTDDALRTGLWFAGGLVGSLLVMSGLSWLLLRGLRWLPSSQLPATLRHGIANLYRPGNHAQSALVALGIGVMFTLTVYLVQHSVLSQIIASAPPGMPNVFILNITPDNREAFAAFLKAQPGVDPKLEIAPSVAVRLTAIDGKPVAPMVASGEARRFRQARQVNFGDKPPENTRVMSGAWWKPNPATPQVSVSQEAARILNVKPGMTLDFSATGRDFKASVAAVHRSESIRAGSGVEFVFNQTALDGVPMLYFGGARIQPAKIAAAQRETYKAFPAISMINVADVIDRAQEVIDQIALVVRFISAFAIIAGVIILASSVAGTRFRRIREVVILKTLGATRRRVATIFSVEFLLLGLVAGLLGSVLATGFSSLLLKRLFDSAFLFDPLPNLIAIVATALIANIAGWFASFRILEQKPLEALRQE